MRTYDKIRKIIVHCSDTPDNRDVDAAEIRRWHMQDNGWNDIGYHFVIKRDGTLEAGRPFLRAGAHTRGNNADSVGICMVGRSTFAPEQFATLDAVIGTIRAALMNKLPVFGHRDFDSGKTCPNDHVYSYLKKYK